MKQLQQLIDKQTKWLVIIILVIACLFRFWNLQQIPISPDWDEVALGYNAYSLLQTGKDEYGKSLPIILESFGDFKPALYAYLIVPGIIFFNLSLFAIRLPSALFGVLTVLATYFFVKEIMKRKDIALLSAFMLAISPWHIQFSRVAFEANIGVALNLFAALFFIKGLKKPWMLSLSSVFAALSVYSYQSEKVFAPLLVLLLVAIYWRDLIKVSSKKILLAVILGSIVIAPMVTSVITDKNTLARAQGTSIFSPANQTVFLQNTISYIAWDKVHNDSLGIFLDNRRFIYIRTAIAGYISHFNFNWLFITGDVIARHHAPGMGLLYLISLPFLLAGMYAVLFNTFPFVLDRKTRWLLFLWFLLVPIPASITNDVPHAVRTLNFLPIVQIFEACGILQFFFWIKQFKKYVQYALLLIVFFGYMFNIGFYIDQYFVQYNYFNSEDWQYGYQQAVEYIQPLVNKYDKVIVSNKVPLDNSYIFFLYYLKYPPQMYQLVAHNQPRGFDKYVFRPIQWENDKKQGKVLFVYSSNEQIPPMHIRTIIYALDGKPVITIGDNL